MNEKERPNMGVRWTERRRKRRDRLTRDQSEEGRCKGRSVQPTGQLKRWLGWAAVQEGSP